MLSVLLLTYVLMLLAGFINRIINTGDASIVGRVMRLILASVATNNTLQGLSSYFDLAR